ncbi:MAG: hypothetical protein F6K41_33540 [Symploca sp. SIO3E6]|nr:hypothetical protein [Caldora sp. SIO3E6]
MKLPNSSQTPHWLQKIQYIVDPLGYLESSYQRCGEIFNAPIIGNYQRLLLVSDPKGLQQLFTRDGKEFYSPSNGLLQVLAGDHSIFCLEGDSHQRERKLLMPPFHGDKMRAYGQTICQLTEQVFNLLTPGQPSQPVVLFRKFL